MKSLSLVNLSFYAGSNLLSMGRLLPVLYLLLLSACASQEIGPSEPAAPLPETVREIESLRNQIAHLEQVIVDKDKIIKDQQIERSNQAQALREVNKEAAQTQARLHRLATKPGTASAIAETEVALAQLNPAKIPADDQIVLAQSRHLLGTASTHYENKQYAAAMNYVMQAKYLLGTMTDPGRKRISYENNLLLEFHAPLELLAKSLVNVRDTPSNQAKILITVKKDTAVIATASQGSWFRVRINGTEGWVFNGLLKQVEH